MRLHKFLHSVGFITSRSDTSLFVYNSNGVVAYLLVYVDDIIVTGSGTSSLESIILKLGDVFSIHNLGLLSFFLSVQVSRGHHGISMSQAEYIKTILGRARM